MHGRLELRSGAARLGVAPDIGGGVADLAVDMPGRGLVPVLRPWAGPSAGPFGLGMNLLAPFSNRVSGGGVTGPDGRFHPVAPNLDGEPLPIHGDAFQKPWQVAERTDARARLVLADGAIGPFRYAAEAVYALSPHGLDVALEMTNAGPELPFGGGFHPWFPRLPGTRLHFAASGLWLEDDRHLPTRHIPPAKMPDWDFSTPRALPRGWINNAFTGWDGQAAIHQPDQGMRLDIAAPGLGTAIVYSPDEAADFFCFEPVSHPVDAHNLPGRPGLRMLAPGAALRLELTLSWQPLPAASG